MEVESFVEEATKFSAEADRIEAEAEAALAETEKLLEQHLKDFPNSPLADDYVSLSLAVTNMFYDGYTEKMTAEIVPCTEEVSTSIPRLK